MILGFLAHLSAAHLPYMHPYPNAYSLSCSVPTAWHRKARHIEPRLLLHLGFDKPGMDI